MEVSKCYPGTISNRCQVFDTNQDEPVSTLTEAEVEYLSNHTHQQQSQADSGMVTQHKHIEPDPNSRCIVDPSSVVKYQKYKNQI